MQASAEELIQGQYAHRPQPLKIHATTPLQVSLTSPEDVDAGVLEWFQKAYDQNR